MEAPRRSTLEQLEGDLNRLVAALPARPHPAWIERERRRALRRPWLELAGTSALILACFTAFAAWGDTKLLLLGAGLSLALLPKRVRAVRERPAALTGPLSSELLEVLEAERSRELAGHLLGLLASLFLMLVFGLGALIGPHPTASLAALGFAVLMGLREVIAFVRWPRTRLRDPEEDEVEDDDDDDDEEDDA